MTAFPPPGVSVLTVGEFTRSIKELLEEAHPDLPEMQGYA